MVAAPRLDAKAIHEHHGDFVWRSLQRLGVREPDLPDLYQEVFLVVHQRLASFEGSSLLTTWLFGICLRVAAAWHRRAYVRREQPVGEVPEVPGHDGTRPDEEALDHEREAQLARVLDTLDLEKRAVFVMYEIDELTCEQIAGIIGAPLGTVYSRLRAARRQFEQAAERLRARERWEEVR